MKTIFLNMKTSQGIETVDSFEMGKEENRKAFTKYHIILLPYKN